MILFKVDLKERKKLYDDKIFIHGFNFTIDIVCIINFLYCFQLKINNF